MALASKRLKPKEWIYRKMPQTEWMKTVMSVKKANPSMKFSDVLKKAKTMYAKKK